MPTTDPAILAHLEWLGFVQPTGLVVSAPALVSAGAILPRSDSEGQRLLLSCLSEDTAAGRSIIADFRQFARTVLGWSLSSRGYAGVDGAPIPPELTVSLPDYGETLTPDLAVRERDPAPGAPPWQLLVLLVPPDVDLDRPWRGAGRLAWSPHSRLERLLRETGVLAGVLCNGHAIRLLSAPRGESSGWFDVRVADLRLTAGRPLVAALRLLLSEQRLLSLPRTQRLAALLAESRKYQNTVSERLAEQVLAALYALLRGLQAANAERNGDLLRDVLRDDPDAVYHGLLTVMLRLIFLLYAEERGLLPADAVWEQYYALASLYEQLRADAALYPDTMHHRYGAWARLLALFRLLHDGAPELGLPRRAGVLFDPDRFPFLEGRPLGSVRQQGQRIVVPRIPDGAIYQVLEKLLILDGERLSYRALDVEQIGAVYETMMGFRLAVATGPTLAIKAEQRGGAPTPLDLAALLTCPPGERANWLREQTGRELPKGVLEGVKAARSLADLPAALRPVVDERATPDIAPAGALVLQPSAERRRSGSHYTPRALSEPIMRATLAPALARLRGADGAPPRPEQILGLAVCDPAMGSGAFLVEACRQLGEALVAAWRVYGGRPPLAADEDEVIVARRLVAQRCLYGVDKNPVAVDLAKVSLWLATLAKTQPFTFLDHALRHGDSLVGLGQAQIEAFHWQAGGRQAALETEAIRQRLAKVAALRAQIRQADGRLSDAALHALWREAQAELAQVREYGDLVALAFFAGSTSKEREARRKEYALAVFDEERLAALRHELVVRRHGELALVPFHWEIEFPEVFQRDRGGFDVIVGNPPFLGGRNLSEAYGETYSKWLIELHAGASGGADLAAHFFRRAFDLLRAGGALGLIATNTIAQGDTRATGLRWICTHGGEIYAARRRVPWPGQAAVIVSVVHLVKGRYHGVKYLDRREAAQITAFLFHRGGHDDPARLAENAGKSFQGSIILGMGFTFDDTDTKGVATPLAEMERLIAANLACREVIFPYIGGEELNSSPTHAHHRYVINFGERTEAACRACWPELMAIVERKVKPERITKDARKYPRMVLEWWKFFNPRPELNAAIAPLRRVLALSRVSQHLAVTFLPARMVYADSLIIFPFETYAAFCALQARPHEVWARFFASSLKDWLRYTPSDCFETYPFPAGWEKDAALEAAGKAYYEYRAGLMVQRNEGLTALYNRFHDPDEDDPAIVRLRELHAAMDAAVLRAYGWDDLLPLACEFVLDYEIDEATWSRRKNPYRYRWPDPVRDEILARLLERNAQRAKGG
ncbi:Eco57I restriction-modification methylase domain-containing protein [Chloroflexus sp.]|uniref:Eco57I restriction-modification methylase domain-containing protein n=1 Tax=Chloroflexus sp. TaxID=1904827 RepID=UPI002ACE23C4|nr:DNA methyltransferase [Chloroflexus sp.]